MKLPPTPPPSGATASMRANRSRDTRPELALRRAVFARGRRYRVGLRVKTPEVTTRPDLVFTKAKVAVYVDGCYWHGCPAHGRMPSDPTGYWHAKIARNRERDRLSTAALVAAGWVVVRIWEHEEIESAADRVEAHLGGSATEEVF